MSPRRRLRTAWGELGRQQTAFVAGLAVLAALVLALVLIPGGGAHRRSASAAPAPSPLPAAAPSTPAVPRKAGGGNRPRRGHARPARRGAGLHPAARRSTRRAGSAPPPPSPHRAAASVRHTTPRPRAAPPRPSVPTLALHRGTSASMSACGAVHHYRVYPSGTPISYSGSVQSPPAARWKVKLRVKLCRAGTFSDFARFDAQRRNRRTGTFSGTFTAPAAGAYSIRAVLYINGSATAQSAKRHFSTR